MIDSCKYCLKSFSKDLLRPLRNEDDRWRKYCPNCLPAVQKDVDSLPWNRK